jgi:hypothetical protein
VALAEIGDRVRLDQLCARVRGTRPSVEQIRFRVGGSRETMRARRPAAAGTSREALREPLDHLARSRSRLRGSADRVAADVISVRVLVASNRVIS